MLVRTSLLALDQAARLQFSIGDGLELWLDDRRLGAREDDRTIAVRLTGPDVPEDLDAVHVRGRIGADSIAESYPAVTDMIFTHVWDGTSVEVNAPGAPATLVTELEVGWEMAARFPRPSRTKWWRKPVIVGGIDMRNLGCGGITPDAVHHLDVVADILWRGNGSRRAPAQARRPRHVSRLKIGPDERAVADGQLVHVFDNAGCFKRSLSTLKGHEVASARTDEAGRVTSWTSAGHRYTIDRRNDTEALLRSPAGVWAVVDFDDHGRAIAVTDQDKSKAILEWSDSGGLARVVDTAGLVTEIERDELGRVSRFSDSTGRRLDVARTDLASGSEVVVLSAEGRETRHRHERQSDGTYVESHSCCGASNPRVVEHRSLGPLGDERIVRSPNGTVTTARRSTRSDKVRQLDVTRTSIVTPGGKTMVTNRRVSRHRTGRTDETFTITNTTAQKHLDAKTHTTRSVSAEGREATSTLVPGESLTLITPGAGELTVEFDANGRVRRRDRQGEIMTYGYDQNGRLTWTDFERWRQHIHHDEQGKVSAMETPDGWLQIARDPAGRVIAVKSPAESVMTIGRRPDGMISAIAYPEVAGQPEIERFTYDLDGLLTGHSFQDQFHIDYERDVAGRVASVTAPGVKVAARYDEITGQLIELTSADGDGVHFEYDGDIGCVEEATGHNPGRIERVFDDSHQIVARRINGAHELHYVRDADGLVTAAGPLRVDRTTNAGLPVALQLGGVTTTRAFDHAGRLVKQETRFGRLALVLFAEDIERDEFGRVSKITETVLGEERIVEYSYNEARRLESVAIDGVRTMSLGYDSNGNIVELDRMGRALHLEVNAADQLVRVAGQPAMHDVCGNFIGIGDDASVRGYTFDGLGRLVGSTDPQGSVSHVLDPIGRPIRISGKAATTTFLWDGDRLAATLDEVGNVDMRFIHAGTGTAPEALIRGDVEYLLVTDHLGSVRVVVDAHDGQVVQSLQYDALGRITTNSAPGWQPFGFAGGLHETAGGLVRFQARTYDPFVGRFLSRDPLGLAGGQTNLYQYALGDPVNNVDPTGLVVAPSGEVSVCDDDFIGNRPLSVDHLYLRSASWADGVRPLSTLGPVGQLLLDWTDSSTHSNDPAHRLSVAERTCGDDDEPRSMPGAATWTQSNAFFDPAWSTLTTAAAPGAWEFDPLGWDEGPTLAESVGRLARVRKSIRRLTPKAHESLSTVIDGLVDQ